MKRIFYPFFFCLVCLTYAYTAQAQRPESIYSRLAAEGKLKKTFKPSAKVVNKLNATRSQQLTEESCPTCSQVTFSSFSPDAYYTSIYGADSVWVHTYVVQYSDPVYSGGFYNFTAGCINFTHYADTTYGPMTYWDGFTVSKTNVVPFPCDTACSESCNILESQFSSITGCGAGGSNDPYAVAYYGYNEDFFPVSHTTLSLNSPSGICGLFVTNNAYAVKSMKCGDSFAHKFGLGDSLVLTITGFNGGSPTGSVRYFLADFRGPSQAYIVDAWKWVNLSSLGTVDSLAFSLATSDVGPYGPNTPMYFCIDNIKLGTDPSCGTCAATDNTQNWFPIGQRKQAANTRQPVALKVSPNPSHDQVLISAKAGNRLEIYDAAGNKKLSKKMTADKETVSLSDYKPGAYVVQVNDGGRTASAQLIKQ